MKEEKGRRRQGTATLAGKPPQQKTGWQSLQALGRASWRDRKCQLEKGTWTAEGTSRQRRIVRAPVKARPKRTGRQLPRKPGCHRHSTSEVGYRAPWGCTGSCFAFDLQASISALTLAMECGLVWWNSAVPASSLLSPACTSALLLLPCPLPKETHPFSPVFCPQLLSSSGKSRQKSGRLQGVGPRGRLDLGCTGSSLPVLSWKEPT